MSLSMRIAVGAALPTAVVVLIVAPFLWAGDYFLVRAALQMAEFVALLPSRYVETHGMLVVVASSVLTAIPVLWLAAWLFHRALEVERDLDEHDRIGA